MLKILKSGAKNEKKALKNIITCNIRHYEYDVPYTIYIIYVIQKMG